MNKKVVICGVDTSKLPKLSAAEHAELMLELKRGNKTSREKFIYANMNLVLMIVKRYNNKNINVDDLFQVGCVGLIKAIDNFNLDYNLKFSTYAVPMIIGEIRRYIRDNTTMRISRSLRDTAYKVLSSREKFINLGIREPSLEQIAEDINLPIFDVTFALDSLSDTISLNEPVYNDGNDAILLQDHVSDNNISNNKLLEKMCIYEAIKSLKAREKQILLLRYFTGKTQIEISNEVGISQAQVSRLEKNALEEIKNSI